MDRLVTPSIEALRPYQGGKPIEELFRERGVADAVKLASNENPLGPSPRAVEAAAHALAEVHRYPDGSAFRLRSAIAEFHGVPLEEVLHGNGSNELIELLIRTFTTPEHHIVFGEPAFSMYRVAVMAHNVDFTAVPTRADLVHDLEAMVAAVRPQTRLVLLDNPNNPTGTYVPRASLEAFLRAVPEHVIVVLDEAYFEYATAEDYPDSLRMRHLRERLVTLRTFSKAYGLAGLRVGYGIGPARILDYVNRLRAPFNVGVPSQEAGIAALADTAHLEASVRLNTEQRRWLTERLEERGFAVTPSQANFLLVDFRMSGAELYDRLLTEGVILRPIGPLPTSLRVTVGTAQQNARFIEALDRVTR
ncbi:MAG: histidinol-phosphate transaminase [Myxococcales bacterium]|jgi:histidinol-phosphate aminotransferase|nr:histidinol-phosphate transaminase [Myxococcales bacterium]